MPCGSKIRRSGSGNSATIPCDFARANALAQRGKVVIGKVLKGRVVDFTIDALGTLGTLTHQQTTRGILVVLEHVSAACAETFPSGSSISW